MSYMIVIDVTIRFSLEILSTMQLFGLRVVV